MQSSSERFASECAFVPIRRGTHKSRGQVRLSTLRYLSKLAVLRHANFEFAPRNAYFLQLSKIVSRLFIGLSAPGGAQHGLEPTLRTTKNPATSAGHVRPTALGRVLLAQPPKRICSKLVLQKPGVRNQPHLGISRQARSVRGLPDKSGLHQHQQSIALSCTASSGHVRFLDLHLWISPHSVERLRFPPPRKFEPPSPIDQAELYRRRTVKRPE